MKFLLYGVAALIVLAMLGPLLRAIAALLRFGTAGAAAALAAAIATAILGVGSAAAAVIALLSFVTVLMLLSPDRGLARPAAVAMREPLPRPQADDAADLARLGQATEDRRAALAWDIVIARAGPDEARLSKAKACCLRLLAEQTNGVAAGSALEAATLVRKSVPEMVEVYLRRMLRQPDPVESDSAYAETVASLEQAAARAARELAVADDGARRAFDLQRDHIARRAGEDIGGL